jgi:hypothetical protein
MDKRYVLHEHVHPSANCYDNHGCRCPPCLSEFNAATKRRRQHREEASHAADSDRPAVAHEASTRADGAHQADAAASTPAVEAVRSP